MNKFICMLFLSLGLILNSQSIIAQDYQPVIEVKSAPLKAVFGTINIGTEFVINERIGVEPILDFSNGLLFNNRKIGLRTFGKFYLDPKLGADRMYLGSYLKVRRTESWLGSDETQTKAALGFLLGYKIVTNTGLIVDFGYGLGRNIVTSTRSLTPSGPNTNTNTSGGLLNLDAVAQISIGYRFGTVNDPIEGDTGKLNRKLKKSSSTQSTQSDRRRKR